MMRSKNEKNGSVRKMPVDSYCAFVIRKLFLLLILLNIDYNSKDVKFCRLNYPQRPVLEALLGGTHLSLNPVLHTVCRRQALKLLLNARFCWKRRIPFEVLTPLKIIFRICFSSMTSNK